MFLSSARPSQLKTKAGLLVSYGEESLDIEALDHLSWPRKRPAEHVVEQFPRASVIPLPHGQSQLAQDRRLRVPSRVDHHAHANLARVGIDAYIRQYEVRNPFDPGERDLREMSEAAYEFAIRAKRVFYKVRATYGEFALPVRVQTRFVDLRTGAEGVVHEELAPLTQQQLPDLLRGDNGKAPASSFKLQLAAETALRYAIELRGDLRDLREAATAWVMIIARDHGLRPSWPGKRAHAGRAMRIVLDEESVTKAQMREKADELVAIASNMWSALCSAAQPAHSTRRGRSRSPR